MRRTLLVLAFVTPLACAVQDTETGAGPAVRPPDGSTPVPAPPRSANRVLHALSSLLEPPRTTGAEVRLHRLAFEPSRGGEGRPDSVQGRLTFSILGDSEADALHVYDELLTMLEEEAWCLDVEPAETTALEGARGILVTELSFHADGGTAPGRQRDRAADDTPRSDLGMLVRQAAVDPAVHLGTIVIRLEDRQPRAGVVEHAYRIRSFERAPRFSLEQLTTFFDLLDGLEGAVVTGLELVPGEETAPGERVTAWNFEAELTRPNTL